MRPIKPRWGAQAPTGGDREEWTGNIGSLSSPKVQAKNSQQANTPLAISQWENFKLSLLLYLIHIDKVQFFNSLVVGEQSL